jgi:undecaprenyl-diphosphatase
VAFVGVLLAIGIVWQRTFINAHWVSDTLAGLWLGAAATTLLWWLFYRVLLKDRGRPLRSVS